MMIRKEILEALRSSIDGRGPVADGSGRHDGHELEPRQGQNRQPITSGRLVTLTHALPDTTTTLTRTSTRPFPTTLSLVTGAPPAILPPQPTRRPTGRPSNIPQIVPSLSLSSSRSISPVPQVTPSAPPPPVVPPVSTRPTTVSSPLPLPTLQTSSPPPPPPVAPVAPTTPAADGRPTPSAGAPALPEQAGISPSMTALPVATSGVDAGAIVGLIILVLTGIAAAIGFFFFLKKCVSKRNDKPRPTGSPSDPILPPDQPNPLAYSSTAAQMSTARSYPAAASHLDALAAKIIARPPMARAYPNVAGQLDALAARAMMDPPAEQEEYVSPQDVVAPGGFGRLVIANDVRGGGGPYSPDDEYGRARGVGVASSFYEGSSTPDRSESPVYGEIPVIPQEYVRR